MICKTVMTPMTEGFIGSWGRLIGEEPGRQIEVENNHPLRLFYGSDQLGHPLFFVISDTKPPLVRLSDAVIVERGVRQLDGRWTLSLTLRDRRFRDEFIRLGDDLVDSSRGGSNESQALQLLVRAVEEWKALFSYSSGHLSLPAIRGVFGELWFGFYRLTESFSPSAVVRAWDGPFGSPQDFKLPSGESFEVKTIHADSSSVRISSAEQLEVSIGSLDLAVVALSDVDEATPSAMSLPQIVQHAEEMLSSNLADVDELNARIRSLGVDVGDTYYEEYWFRVDTCDTYRVEASFPSIRRSKLNPAVDNVRYEIALRGIAEYQSSTWPSSATDHTTRG